LPPGGNPPKWGQLGWGGFSGFSIGLLFTNFFQVPKISFLFLPYLPRWKAGLFTVYRVLAHCPHPGNSDSHSGWSDTRCGKSDFHPGKSEAIGVNSDSRQDLGMLPSKPEPHPVRGNAIVWRKLFFGRRPIQNQKSKI